MLVVADPHRRPGIGTALVRAIVDADTGVSWVLQAGRAGAARVFAAIGFVAAPQAMPQHSGCVNAGRTVAQYAAATTRLVLSSYLLLIDQRTVQMPATATLSAKFQISIPKPVRDEQRWSAGQEFVFIPKGKGVLLMPVPELAQLAGIAKGASTDRIRDRTDRV